MPEQLHEFANKSLPLVLKLQNPETLEATLILMFFNIYKKEWTTLSYAFAKCSAFSPLKFLVVSG